MESQYCKKASFANEEIAMKFIKKLQETSKRQKVPKSAYLCPKCMTWHITSSRQWDDESDEAKKYKNQIAKLGRQLMDANNRIKRLERQKAKHHEQVYELNQRIESYKRINAKNEGTK